MSACFVPVYYDAQRNVVVTPLLDVMTYIHGTILTEIRKLSILGP